MDVESRFKEQADCQCGCGAVGQLRRRPWANGVHCTKNCTTCRQCKASEKSKLGNNYQRSSRRRHNIPGGMGTGHEQDEHSPIWREAKTGTRVKSLITTYVDLYAEAIEKQPYGNNKPFVLDAAANQDAALTVTCFGHRNKQEAFDAVFALAILHGIVKEDGTSAL